MVHRKPTPRGLPCDLFQEPEKAGGPRTRFTDNGLTTRVLQVTPDGETTPMRANQGRHGDTPLGWGNGFQEIERPRLR